MLGQTLGRFRILEQLGQGGMGIVYRARDTRLDRDVALKVLPPDRVADPSRRQRFEQEARAASALQHPNIVTIYDITREGDRDVIVMELVSGETLDRLIRRRGLELGQALGYAVQIADGLAKAHAAGLVHRDLKPSNIMVTEDGTVKILDFGLAKLFERESDAVAAPTVTAPGRAESATQNGGIVGTAAYMSPEQAAGKKVDSRSDIFSFGSVLYEMLTRRRAFQRETTTTTLAAIIAEEPEPAGRAVGDLPPELERAIERCLRKDPQRRWQGMSDLRVVLQDLKEDSDSGKLRPVAPVRRRRSRWGWWAALVLAMAGITAAIAWLMAGRPQPAGGMTVNRVTFDAGVTAFSAISPDGRLFAYASDRAQAGNLDIWVQQAAGGQPLRLTDHPTPDTTPSFSPDGSRIAFRSERDGGGIYVIDTLGGDARRIATRGSFPRFSPDGSQIAFVDIPPSLVPSLAAIHLVAAEGGVSRPFLPDFAPAGAAISSHPIWSPDGRSLLFLGTRGGDSTTTDWWIAPLDGRPPTRLDAISRLSIELPWGFPRAWTNGFIYYVAGTTVEGVNIFRVPFDAARMAFGGRPEPLTIGGGMKWEAELARDGHMVFSHLTWTLNVWSAALQADHGKVIGELTPVTQDESVKFDPRISREGKTLVYTAFTGWQTRAPEVRIRDLASGRETAIQAVPGAQNQMPVLSADGALVAYRRPSGGRSAYYIRAPGSTTDAQLCEGCTVHAFFSDQSFALVQYGPRELVRQHVSTGERVPVLHLEDGSILDARPSWNDRWITFLVGLPGGRPAIYVAPLRDAATPIGEWVLVRQDDRILGAPRWSPDGTWLYYMSAADGFLCVWGQRFDPASRKPAGSPVAVLHLHSSRGATFPLNRGSLEITSDRLMVLLGESKGNIYMATLGRW